jgi:hypothetical protein
MYYSSGVLITPKALRTVSRTCKTRSVISLQSPTHICEAKVMVETMVDDIVGSIRQWCSCSTIIFPTTTQCAPRLQAQSFTSTGSFDTGFVGLKVTTTLPIADQAWILGRMMTLLQAQNVRGPERISQPQPMYSNVLIPQCTVPE